MCKQLLGPHNVKQALLSRGLVMGVTNAILSSHTGTADLYLVRAALRAGFKPAIITTAYNRGKSEDGGLLESDLFDLPTGFTAEDVANESRELWTQQVRAAALRHCQTRYASL